MLTGMYSLIGCLADRQIENTALEDTFPDSQHNVL